ncbi:MAG: LysR family transcriptional regulator, partial [Lacipirellulaceae bacterium]
MTETRQLRYFLTLADELHFGRAAQRLGIAQPPLSHQIKKLELELGVQLFRRTSRVVELTEAGRLLLPEARMILERVGAFGSIASQYSAGILGPLHVGAVSPALDTFLPSLIMAMRSAYPNVQLTIREMRTSEQLDRLNTGQLDIGFIRHYRQDLKLYESRLLRRDAYVLAVHCEHPLASRKRIRLSDLDKAPMIMS